MSTHDHRDYVHWCFRCDLSRAEVTDTDVSLDPADMVASIRRGLADMAAGRVVRDDSLLEDGD